MFASVLKCTNTPALAGLIVTDDVIVSVVEAGAKFVLAPQAIGATIEVCAWAGKTPVASSGFVHLLGIFANAAAQW